MTTILFKDLIVLWPMVHLSYHPSGMPKENLHAIIIGFMFYKCQFCILADNIQERFIIFLLQFL